MKWAHKKDCIADCKYDVSQYILDDNYYKFTKQFKKSARQVIIQFRWTYFSIAVPVWCELIISFVLAIYYLNKDSNNNLDSIYGIICFVAGMGVD